MSKDIIGIKVNHDSFGIGEIIDFLDHKISVRFDSGKISRFVLKNLGNNFIDIIDAESEENKRIFKEIIDGERLFEIQEKVFNVLEGEYKFEGFVHYTAYNNLESIFDSGCLYSRNDMKNNRLLWKDVASESVLGNTSEK